VLLMSFGNEGDGFPEKFQTAMKRKICVITGTRAEYGLLYWLMKEIQDDSALGLQVIVTGMHLSPEFGLISRLKRTVFLFIKSGNAVVF